MNKSIKVLAPASVANLVCGFDVLGMSLADPADEMIMSLTDTPGIKIIHEDEYNLPEEAEKNVAGAALLAMMKELDPQTGFFLRVKKTIKPGSGLGSSAASAAGAVAGANALLGNKFSQDDLVRFAMSGEKLASGVKHADNIAPCLMGGITLIRSIMPLDIVKVSFPELYVTVVHPQIEVKTSDAREILRKQVLLKDAIKQWGNIAGLVAGFMQKDYSLIGRSLEDVIIEPVRSILIPGFNEVKEKCKNAGALGGGISGSGPSVFMLSVEEKTANRVSEVMREVYSCLGIDFKIYVTKIDEKGVKIEVFQHQ
ncbi:MAG: homoserine kinase [Chitinophagaceae bacterium]|nr:homoserine kinase [Chitinophagaceae bacterium]